MCRVTSLPSRICVGIHFCVEGFRCDDVRIELFHQRLFNILKLGRAARVDEVPVEIRGRFVGATSLFVKLRRKHVLVRASLTVVSLDIYVGIRFSAR